MQELSFDALKKCGNLYEKLTDPNVPLYVVRVYSYRSHTRDLLYQIDDDVYNSRLQGEEKDFVQLLRDIRRKVDDLNWNDNKIVIELSINEVSEYGWRIFIGFWDWTISIGGAVLPNFYTPHCKTSDTGYIEPVKIR